MKPRHVPALRSAAPCTGRGGWLRCLLAMLMLLGGQHVVYADDASTDTAAGLQAKFAELRAKLENNAFQKPLYLESIEAGGQLKAHVYSVLSHPYATVQTELKQPSHWCDILILHPNTKYCRPSGAGPGTVLKVNIGRKADQPIGQSYRVDFAYRVLEASPEHLGVFLSAEKGPFGTHDYRLLLEAVPLKSGQTFLHLSYSYGYGTGAKLALLTYLNTAASKKVGFTVTGTRKDGQPDYIGGLRGLIERNTMRYHLAIEAYFDALAVAPTARPEKRFTDWYAANERYPRQLHEIGSQEYMEMKRKEYLRQQSEL